MLQCPSGSATRQPLKSTLVFQAAAITSDILEALGRDGHFTLFAPTNEAFEKLPRGVLERIMGDKVASEGIKTSSSMRRLPESQAGKERKMRGSGQYCQVEKQRQTNF